MENGRSLVSVPILLPLAGLAHPATSAPSRGPLGPKKSRRSSQGFELSWGGRRGGRRCCLTLILLKPQLSSIGGWDHVGHHGEG